MQAMVPLDPILGDPTQDDGRAAIATQIADRFISLTSFMDKTNANMMLFGLMRWLGSTLGANPSLEKWQSVLAELQSHIGRGQQGGHLPPPAVNSVPVHTGTGESYDLRQQRPVGIGY